MSDGIPKKVQEYLDDPSKSLGRLLFSKFGTVFNGRRDGRNEYLGTAPTVCALLSAASKLSWATAQLPDDNPNPDRKKFGWQGYMGCLLYTNSREFFGGRVDKLDLHNPNHKQTHETST